MEGARRASNLGVVLGCPGIRRELERHARSRSYIVEPSHESVIHERGLLELDDGEMFERREGQHQSVTPHASNSCRSCSTIASLCSFGPTTRRSTCPHTASVWTAIRKPSARALSQKFESSPTLDMKEPCAPVGFARRWFRASSVAHPLRSEEHTSSSHSQISYA